MNIKKNLGRWALIDIETTGVDAHHDEIIDIGFLQFEGTKLVHEYSSLVKSEKNLSFFIQKLTGITDSMLKNAPSWKKVLPDLWTLQGHALLAHNAQFEEKFLAKHFTSDSDAPEEKVRFCDSLYYLSLLFPEKSSLNLESFIIELAISDKEEHRGLADAKDLLKVLLVATYLTHLDKEFRLFLSHELTQFHPNEFWYVNFFSLDTTELMELAESIDFDLLDCVEKYKHNKMAKLDDDSVSVKNAHYQFDGASIKKVFSNIGEIQKVLPSYYYRKGQEDLALKIGQSFKNNLVSMIQAPTGTGKTMGYLVPSFLFALNEKKQVLISTGTKALQHQAMQKDIPQVYKLLGLTKDDIKVERLVGSNNHFCELLFRNETNSDSLIGLKNFGERFAKAYMEMVIFYNQRAAQNNIVTTDGTPYVFKRMHLEFEEFLGKIAVDYRSCTGSKCPFKNGCTYMRGLKTAKEADIILGNHALSFTWPKSMPRPEYIVMDEAHRLENESTRAFSRIVTQKDFEQLGSTLAQSIAPIYYLLGNEAVPQDERIKHIRRESQDAQEMIRDHLEPFKHIVEKYMQSLPNYTELYWNERPMINKNLVNGENEVILINHLESINHIINSLMILMTPYLTRWNTDDFADNPNKMVAYTAFTSFVDHLGDVSNALSTVLSLDSSYAHSLKYHVDYGYSLESAPIDIGKIIHDELLVPSSSVVFTSATLANAGGTLGVAGAEWMTGQSYLDTSRRFKKGLFLDEVYNYEKQAKVFLATDVPDINTYHYVDDILKEVVPLIRSLKGSTLLLFSSRVRFERVSEILLQKFDGEIPVFVQGMGGQVVEDFKKSPHAILVGMETFSEGIDIPGDALQFVYIDKVPDLRMDLVIQKRRDFYERAFGNEFTDYYLSHRTRSLHQKLGRLIRAENDKGGILITDPRIKRWKGQTLKGFADLMRPYQLQMTDLKSACQEIEKFIIS